MQSQIARIEITKTIQELMLIIQILISDCFLLWWPIIIWYADDFFPKSAVQNAL